MRDTFNALSPAEQHHFQQLGAAGNLAWRHGYASFGPRDRQKRSRASLEDVGTEMPDGRLVLADAARPAELQQLSFRDFAADIREIRGKFRKLQAAQKSEARRQQMEMQQARAASVARAPATW